MLERAIEIDNEIDKLEYELKIATLNDRYYDIECIKSDLRDLENELTSMGY